MFWVFSSLILCFSRVFTGVERGKKILGVCVVFLGFCLNTKEWKIGVVFSRFLEAILVKISLACLKNRFEMVFGWFWTARASRDRGGELDPFRIGPVVFFQSRLTLSLHFSRAKKAQKHKETPPQSSQFRKYSLGGSSFPGKFGQRFMGSFYMGSLHICMTNLSCVILVL